MSKYNSYFCQDLQLNLIEEYTIFGNFHDRKEINFENYYNSRYFIFYNFHFIEKFIKQNKNFLIFLTVNLKGLIRFTMILWLKFKSNFIFYFI